mgnify:FL=1
MAAPIAEREHVVTWIEGSPISAFLEDSTREVDLEGALNSGKTTAALWKIRNYCTAWPGIKCLIARYAQGDTERLLRPRWEEICREAGEIPPWQAREEYYAFRNGSRVYAFGLMVQEAQRRQAKIRGWDGAVIYVDQAEELPPDIILALFGRPRQQGMPHQVIFTPNPLSERDFLSGLFPTDNRIQGRRYYSVSLDHNAHNLMPGTVEALKRAYPPTHAAHRSLILGQRGLRVVGQPVYGPHLDRPGAFRREVHIRPIAYDPKGLVYESFDYGMHHPCWIVAQQPYTGGWHILGGVLGQDLYLDEFLPIVKRYRALWCPAMTGLLSCCDPAGTHESSQGVRQNGLSILRDYDITPVWRDNSNAPDVRYATIERLAALMLRRSVSGGEAFSVNNDPSRWIVVSADGPREGMAILADGCEAGYVWDPIDVSVGSKKVRRPRKEKWYEHPMNCLEYLELNFGADQPTQEEQARAKAKAPTQAPGYGEQSWMG